MPDLTRDDLFHLANIGPEIEEIYGLDQPVLAWWDYVTDEELEEWLQRETLTDEGMEGEQSCI